jgi:hypothetical protein
MLAVGRNVSDEDMSLHELNSTVMSGLKNEYKDLRTEIDIIWVRNTLEQNLQIDSEIACTS